MRAIEILGKLLGESSLNGSQYCELVGIRRPSLNDLLKQKSLSADRMSEYLEPLHYSVVVVPSEQVRFLPKGSYVIGGRDDE